MERTSVNAFRIWKKALATEFNCCLEYRIAQVERES